MQFQIFPGDYLQSAASGGKMEPIGRTLRPSTPDGCGLPALFCKAKHTDLILITIIELTLNYILQPPHDIKLRRQ